jgi:glutamate/tyrosine decarboxylase-like PLP-dependent enzyme
MRSEGTTQGWPMTAAEKTQQDVRALLEQTAARAATYLEGLAERRVAPEVGVDELREALSVPLQRDPLPGDQVVAELCEAAEDGLMATAGPRFFGFVIGGALPAAVAADWLATAWDQNAGLYVAAPAATVAEETAVTWLKQLLRLPADASVGLVTGGQMANFTCLAAARHHVLQQVGWDVERRGLVGAPALHVLAGDSHHVTIPRALRFLGLGTDAVIEVATDRQGRMRPEALQTALRMAPGPTIVCAQLGDVNTGALDPVGAIAEVAHAHGAWVHVDGAFGLWARASRRLDAATEGTERADSWSTDAHKWLNVPYDCGLAFTAHPGAHRAAMGTHASYLVHSEGAERDAMDWNPEFSRRARGLAVYAALRSLGTAGVEALVDRCCALARRFADAFDAADGAEVVNDVVLNQVLVRFPDPAGDTDGRTRAVIERVQRDGTCWLGGSTWHGRQVMRISVSGWSTTEEDVDRSVAAVLRAAHGV